MFLRRCVFCDNLWPLRNSPRVNADVHRQESSSMHLVNARFVKCIQVLAFAVDGFICECIFVRREIHFMCARLSLLCCKDVCASCGCVASSLSRSANEGSGKELRPQVCMCSHASLLLRLCVRWLALFHLKENERRLCEASLYYVAQSSV
jgi:hypothetical protein